MLSAWSHLAGRLLAELPLLPGEQPGYGKPAGATSPKYIEFLENNSTLIYPLIAVVALGLIVIGILQAWRGQDLDLTQRRQLKKDIVLELRKAGTGLSADDIARAIGMEKFKTQKLLEDLANDGLLYVYTNTERLSVWQLKGVGETTGGYGSH